MVDIIHVQTPQGSGRSKRDVLNIKDFLHKKKSIITIQNNDNLCLARALVVAIAKIEKDPKYKQLTNPDKRVQERKARELHEAANVPLGPCGIPEVELFQKYLTNYEINIVSGNHNNSIIYPSKPSPDNNVTPIYLYLHDNHYDIITSMPGFLSDQYFCHKCRRSYTHKLNHLCPGMCKSCRSYDCVVNDPLECNVCNRWFKSKACYDRHKEPVDGTRSVCQGIKKCGKCGKSVEVRKLNPKNHVCGKKCSTCGLVLNEKSEHKCYIQKTEQTEESQYSELLFFDLECSKNMEFTRLIYVLSITKQGTSGYFRGAIPLRNFANGY